MVSRTSRFFEVSYCLMRLVVGILFACHGAQKLFGSFGGHVMTGKPLILIAAIIELLGGLLIAAGLFTRIVAFLASGEMAVAYFLSHAPHGFWPIENKGELAVVYCFVFLVIASAGGGTYSLDRVFGRKAG